MLNWEGLLSPDVTRHDGRMAGAGEGGQDVAGGVILIVAAHTAEVVVGLEDGSGVGEIQLEQEHAEGQGVCQAARQQHPAPGTARHVLVYQQQVVAEVEVGLPGVALVQAGTAYMKDLGIGDRTATEAGTPDAGAEVYLLHVGEKLRIKAAELQV